MRVVYVANHDSGGNDDEGAIHHALTELGHDVRRIREVNGARAHVLDGDFLLFHKWTGAAITKSKLPKVFWYFDRVTDPDPSPASIKRCRGRVDWMGMTLPHVALGFCTDGDWVVQDKTDKLVWLPQGADERVIGRGNAACPTCGGPAPIVDILFTGISHGGDRRISFVKKMTERYGSRFRHVPSGVHGRAMANLIASASIVVAPDWPMSDRYWSNRVYNALGFGAFLLHPYCDRLTSQYRADELIVYKDRDDLYVKIDQFLSAPGYRLQVSEAGLQRTIVEHLYRHRCAKLIEVVKERLCLK